MTTPRWAELIRYIISVLAPELDDVPIYTDRPGVDPATASYVVLSLLDINPEYTLGGSAYYTATLRFIAVSKLGAVAAMSALDTVHSVLAGTQAEIGGDRVQFVYTNTRQVEVDDGWVYQSEYKVFYIIG